MAWLRNLVLGRKEEDELEYLASDPIYSTQSGYKAPPIAVQELSETVIEAQPIDAPTSVNSGYVETISTEDKFAFMHEIITDLTDENRQLYIDRTYFMEKAACRLLTDEEIAAGGTESQIAPPPKGWFR